MLRTRALLTAAALLAAVNVTAYGHGGRYQGPAGEVPPESRDPQDPPPPPEGGTPQTPGGENPAGPETGDGNGPGGTPGTPGGGGGAPDGGGGSPTGPSGGGPGGPSSPRTKPKVSGYEDWTFWWNANKASLLPGRSQFRRRSAPTSSGLRRLGRGGGDFIATTDEAIQVDVVPALRALLDQSDLDGDIRSSAAIALAKIGDQSTVATLRALATARGRARDVDRITQESAALAFGLLQFRTEEVRDVLLELLTDRSQDASFVRPFAAVSLGLLVGDRPDAAVREALLRVIAGDEPKGDVKPAALLALGLSHDPAALPHLVAVVENGRLQREGAAKLNDVELAYAVEALGRLGVPGDGGASVVALQRVLERPAGHSTAVRRSASIALGLLGPACEPRQQRAILRTLARVAEGDRALGGDTSERTFALVSIGRIAGAPTAGADLRGDAVGVLRKRLESGAPIEQPFAGLAMGLVARAAPADAAGFVEEEIRRPLRVKFADTKELRARGAYAIALGLTRDRGAGQALRDAFADRGNGPELRGYCALALGMIGDESAGPAVREALVTETDRNLRLHTALAAGLLCDGRVVEDLVKILRSPDETQYVLGSVSLALGQIGDERAVAALLEIAEDKDRRWPALTRALAVVALGGLGDRREPPTLARVTTDINYRAHVPAIAELLSIL